MPHAVLIIDDEATLAKNMKTYLERYGYLVAAAGTGEEGLAQMDTFRPDLVVVDYHLPRMSGIEVLERLQSQARKIKAIMITGQGSAEVAAKARNAGAHEYLAKPLALSALRLLVELTLQGPRPAACA